MSVKKKLYCIFCIGDNEKDWVCDCKPVHVYYPETMKCYQVYDQGRLLNKLYSLKVILKIYSQFKVHAKKEKFCN